MLKLTHIRVPFQLEWQLVYLLLVLLECLVDLLQRLNLLVKCWNATIFEAFDVLFVHAHFLHVLQVLLSYLASILLKLCMEVSSCRFFLLILCCSIRWVLVMVAIHIPMVIRLLILFHRIFLVSLLLGFLLHFWLEAVGLSCLATNRTFIWQVTISGHYQLTPRFTIYFEKLFLMCAVEVLILFLYPRLERLRFGHNELGIAMSILGSTILDLTGFIKSVGSIWNGPLLESCLILKLFVGSSN